MWSSSIGLQGQSLLRSRPRDAGSPPGQLETATINMAAFLPVRVLHQVKSLPPLSSPPALASDSEKCSR